MKVLFLDFDGVANTWAHLCTLTGNRTPPVDDLERGFLASVANKEDPERELWSYRHIERVKVPLLNQIVDRTGAKVVISSSWRRGTSVEELQQLLFFHGFTGEVIGKTAEDLHRREEYVKRAEEEGHDNIWRGWEIQEWLDRHPEVTSFSILDDESDMNGVEGHLVQTDFDNGLTQEHVDQVVAMLGAV